MARLTTLDEREQPSVIVDPSAKAGTPAHVQRVSSVRPRLRAGGAVSSPAATGTWIVILMYVVSAGALAYALYERFGG